MRALFGRGLHPDAEQIVALEVAADATPESAAQVVKLGRAFPQYKPLPSRSDRVAARLAEWERENGVPRLRWCARRSRPRRQGTPRRGRLRPGLHPGEERLPALGAGIRRHPAGGGGRPPRDGRRHAGPARARDGSPTTPANAEPSFRPLGDPAQLTSVEAGGMLRLLAHDTGAVELTDLHRFIDPDESTAPIGIREGRAEALDFYLRPDRAHSGSTDAMLEAAYDAWEHDTRAGRSRAAPSTLPTCSSTTP